MQYVDAQGFVRVADPNAPAPMTSWEALQGSLSDALSDHGAGGPVKGQSEQQDFLVAVGQASGGQVYFHCFPIEGSHEYKYSWAQVVEAARKMNRTPYRVY